MQWLLKHHKAIADYLHKRSVEVYSNLSIRTLSP